MRIDKKAKSVVREAAVETKAIVEAELPDEEETKPVNKDKHAAAIRPPKSTGRKTLLNPKDETQYVR
jgi:bifunctional non-homologous end joining protein LigD